MAAWDWLASGPSYALLTAGAWAVAVLLFKRSGEDISPTGLNLFKNVVALGLLALTFLVSGQPLRSDAGWSEIAALLASGVVGIGVADTLFFRSLNALGAGRSAIVDCLYSPFVVVTSWLILGERLTTPAALGAALIVGAILLAASEDPHEPIPRARLREGILLGALSMTLMSVSIVAVKPILERHSVLWSTTARMVGGIAALVPPVLLSRGTRAHVVAAFRPRAAWKFAIPGSIAGTYLALLFWIAGFKHGTAGITAILNQTSSLLVVVLAAVFLREPLTWRKAVAVLLGFAGGVFALR